MGIGIDVEIKVEARIMIKAVKFGSSIVGELGRNLQRLMADWAGIVHRMSELGAIDLKLMSAD